jgi:hypothetical protein
MQDPCEPIFSVGTHISQVATCVLTRPMAPVIHPVCSSERAIKIMLIMSLGLVTDISCVESLQETGQHTIEGSGRLGAVIDGRMLERIVSVLSSRFTERTL